MRASSAVGRGLREKCSCEVRWFPAQRGSLLAQSVTDCRAHCRPLGLLSPGAVAKW